VPATILTVLRSGGEYRPEHVERLRAQCATHAPDAPFLCLSDVPGVGQPLVHGWPGWWSKIEAFGARGPVLYMDLDTHVVGDLTPLLRVAVAARFTVLRDFNPKHRLIGSGLMAWAGDMSHLVRRFEESPARHMAANKSSRFWGDQGFIERHEVRPAFWQDRLPGAVVSWKKHCGQGIPADARVVCFHGKPRPWEVGL